jgi:predicted DNA-binding transcriptional regulator AlpA
VPEHLRVSGPQTMAESATERLSDLNTEVPKMKTQLPKTIRAELISAEDAARMTGCQRRSWFRYVASGKAPRAIRLGGKVLWRRSDLIAWIEAGCPAAKASGKGGAR